MVFPPPKSKRGRARLCAVFDLDDTLYLERDYVRSGFEAVGQWAQAHLGLEGFALRAWRYFEGGRRGDIFNCVLRDLGCVQDGSLVGEAVAVYRSHSPRISLCADTVTCLGFLKGKIPTAIVSDGASVSQMAKIEALKLNTMIDTIILTDTLGPGHSKPSLVPFLRVADLWGSYVEGFVYAGDNPAKDFEAPRALGWTTVRVRRPGGLHATVPAVRGLEPDLEVRDLLEFLNALWPEWRAG